MLILSFLIWLPSLLTADTPNQQRFEHLTIEDGLSQSTINCIHQDSRGFMLFGTQFGLNRYDGLKFTVQKPHPHHIQRINANEIYAFLETPDGTLWIGTRKGINKYNRILDTYTHFMRKEGDPTTLSNNLVIDMSMDSNGYIWTATEMGLNRFDPRTNKVKRYIHDPQDPATISDNYIYCVEVDSRQMVWVGTDNGLNRIDPRSGEIQRFFHDPGNPVSISSNQIFTIYEDRYGTVWLGTKNGLNKFHRGQDTFVSYKSNPDDPFSISDNSITALLEDSNGSFWVGTGNGLNKFDRGHGTFIGFKHDVSEPLSLSGNYITALFEDRSGILWIGTYTGGINKFILKKKPFNHILVTHDKIKNPARNDIWSIRETSDKKLWLGTDEVGLFTYDRNNGFFTNYSHQKDKPDSLSHNTVYSIYEDRHKQLWIGTEKGLNRFDRATCSFRRFFSDPNDPLTLSSDCVLVIMEDRHHRLWFGTWKGVNTYNPQTGSFTSYLHDSSNPQSLSNDVIYALYEDRDGHFWVGTFKGLNRFDRRNGTFTNYRHKVNDPTTISNDGISCVLQDKKGKLWVGTDCGLNLFDPVTETFKHFCEEEGLPNDVIYGILEDDQGFLWISTNKGITKFDPETAIFKNYTIRDGLQDFEFNMGSFYKSESGEMFFGGISGMNAFFPDFIKDNNHIPPIAITGFQLFNQTVGIGEKFGGRTLLTKSITETESIDLRYNQNNFTFEFSALDYVYPEANRYAFMMEGFEKEWNEVGTRTFANYINLPPGEYRFRVKGSNNDSVWNHRGASMGIVISPPFWSTIWFQTLAALMAMAIALAFYKFKTKQIKRRNLELLSINTQLNQQITVRKKAESELKNSQSQLRALSNHLESAREEERVRIAREIHDELGQSMTALKMDIAWVKKKTSAPQPPIPQKLDMMLKQADNVIQTVKRISSDLRPGLLDHLGLGPAIQWQVEKFNKHTEIGCQLLQEPEEIILDDNVSTAVFRIFQEALTNVRRHAAATEVKIALVLKNNMLELTVSDNGIGIRDDRLHAPHSFGIIGMHERVRHLGGNLTILGEKNRGTTLRVVIPIMTEEIDDD
jgi:signal transduction histidine kinase/ligand-binding sensor domain-containing protein